MPRTCTICIHEEKKEINKALINNVPLRTIADQYGVSKTALLRHKADHLPGILLKAQERKDIRQADSLLGQVKDLLIRTLNIMDQAEEQGDIRIALSAIREARGNLELLAKLLGDIQDSPTVNISLSPEWVDLRTNILMVLDPYPEAKAKLVEVLTHAGS